MVKTLFAIVISITLFSSFCYALDVATHKALNENIAKKTLNGFSLDAYLKNNLGIRDGMTTSFNSLNAWQWLRDGGYYEDKPDQTFPYLRSANHFHNPLAPSLDKAGFTGIWDIPHFVSGQSAVLWSQYPKKTQSPGGYFSWHDVRDYFYTALTSTTLDVRKTYFAQTFRGVGQIMHLVQDQSVPEHSRNDGHYADAYEESVKNMQTDPQRKAVFDTSLANPIFFKWSRLTQLESAFPSASVPIANLFDTKQYGGANPAITIQYLETITSPTGTIKTDLIGLAEYSNANFVSPDTLFKNFPYPKKDTSVTVVDYPIPDPLNPGTTKNRPYYKKTADGDTGYRLAGENVFWFYGQGYLPTSPDAIGLPIFDDYVYQDYAEKLLPRAVGYSAGLLNYFFRGQINLIEPDPDNQPGKYVIRNDSDENMEGTFSVYYDDINDNRKSLGQWQHVSIGAQTETDPLATSITFTIPTNAKMRDSYILVFRGQLGNENDAVVGRVTRAFREEWNNGLNNNHPWLYSDTDLHNNSSSGQIANTIVNNRLVKDNTTDVGASNGNINETLIGQSWDAPVDSPYPGSASPSYCTDPIFGPRYCLDSACWTCFQDDFGKEFPVPINEDTQLSLKIDSMTKNVPLACLYWPQEGAYQGIVLGFAVGPDKWDIKVNFTLPGNEAFYYINKNIVVPQNQDYSVNIYEMLAPLVQLLEPINLYEVKIIQWIHCGSIGTAYQQHMEVDYVRVMDR